MWSTVARLLILYLHKLLVAAAYMATCAISAPQMPVLRQYFFYDCKEKRAALIAQETRVKSRANLRAFLQTIRTRLIL